MSTMAHNAGHGGWWAPPPQADGGGAGQGVDSQLIRELIAAMGASVANMNSNVVALGQIIA